MPYNIKVSLNCVKTNYKQKLMIIATKPSQRLGAAPPDPHIWDLLPGAAAAPENFLPMPLFSYGLSNKFQNIEVDIATL